MEAVTEPKARRSRQLRLFPVSNPLSEHIGDAFFRALPCLPGVYFFYDEADRLLYIGQSSNLRARVGSYRHVNFEKHARRTLRLVHRVRRIEWEICESMEAAIELERGLLLERRPPFNRAGVWQAPPWWLRMKQQDDAILLSLERRAALPDDGAEAGMVCFGPYGASFPFVHAALVRTALRQCRPGIRHADFPAGFLQERLVSEVMLRSGAFTPVLAESIPAFLNGTKMSFPADMPNAAESPRDTFEEHLWQADAERLLEFFERLSGNATPAAA